MRMFPEFSHCARFGFVVNLSGIVCILRVRAAEDALISQDMGQLGAPSPPARTSTLFKGMAFLITGYEKVGRVRIIA